MKKALSVLLCLCLVLSVFTVVPFAASAAEVTEETVGAKSGTTGSCRWSLDDEGTLTISGNGAMGDYSYKYSVGIKITTAPWEANIKTVVIEDSVTSIGDYAFYGCTGLTNVTIGNSVTSIGKYAFYGCTGLTSVTIPDSVTRIGSYAFSSCTGLTSVTIGNSVTSIGSSAFEDCKNLTSVTIGNSVTSIGGDAFRGCKSLKSVTIPNSVTSIVGSAFSNTGWYNNQPDGLVYAGKVAYKYKGTMPANTSITIKDGTKGIAGSAFYNCTGLTIVTIPDSVTSIDSSAFSYCTGLTSVTIPNSVTRIGDYAFRGCTRLTSVTIPNSVTSISDYAFYNCTGLTSVTIPDSVTSIGSSAFYNCTGLTSVTIPSSVTSIGGSAFSGCTCLTNVTIGNSVTSIGEWAFYGCTGLTSVTIPNSVTSIGTKAVGYYFNDGYQKVAGFTIYGIQGSEAERYAKSNGFTFRAGEKICPHCHSLLSSEQLITFAATCTEDGERYWQCDQCAELGKDVLPALGHDYIAAITPPTCTKGGYTTHTCSRCKDAYVSDKVAALGHDYQAVVTAPTCTKGGYTTHTCSRCKDTYVSDEVAALGHDYHQTAVIPPTCTEEGYTSYTCSRCSDIKNDDFVDALGHNCTITVMRQPTETQQGVMAVDCQRCNLKKNVLLPVLSDQDYTLTTSAEPGKVTYTLKDKTYGVYETVADAPEGWFAGGTTGDCKWEKKGNLLIISGNGKMDNYTDSTPAPWKGADITEVIIEKGVTNIGAYAFKDCTGLTSVTIPDSVTSIGHDAFYGCISLTSIHIPDSVTSMGSDVFSRCTALTNVHLPDSIWRIPTGFFDRCISLKNIEIPNSVRQIEMGAFYGTGLTSVTLSENVTSVEKISFKSCYDLKKVTILNPHLYFNDINQTSPSGGRIAWLAMGWYYDEARDDVYRVPGFTIYGYADSSAEKYANDNGFTFVKLEAKTDSSSDVSVEVPSAYGISVEKLTGQQASDSAKGLANVSAVYHIDVTQNGTAVQPESLGYIKLPRSGNSQKVYRREADGSFTEMKTSFSDGFYVFTSDYCGDFVLADGIVQYVIGDADSDRNITISDVTAIQRHMAEFDILTGTALLAADTNGDGKVDINDATHLQRYLAEFDVVLGKQN